MAWPPPPTLPEEEVVAKWWRAAEQARESRAQPETSPVVDRPEWRAAALAAKVRRVLWDIDVALAPVCDCGDTGGCRWCQPSVDRRHTGPTPGHGIEARWAGPIEHSHYVGARVLSVR